MSYVKYDLRHTIRQKYFAFRRILICSITFKRFRPLLDVDPMFEKTFCSTSTLTLNAKFREAK